MSKQKWQSSALAAYVAIASMLPFALHNRWAEGHYTWAEYGTWLEGALTPALLLFAALTFKGDADAQREANRLSTHALFMANIAGYLHHLNYVCTAAVIGNHLPAAEVEEENLEGVGRLLDIVTTKRADAKYPTGHKREAMSYEKILAGPEMPIVTRDIDSVIGLAKRAGVEFLLDPRIVELQEKLQLLRRR